MTLAKTAIRQQKWLGWMVFILLSAAALRLIALTEIPPGLTHDEADHGLTAVSILAGARDIYFSIGHGREPLYDYVTATVMAGMGQSYLAGRLTAVLFSLILLAGMAAWVRRAFNWQTAVLTAAGLAVGFWPLMTARQSLRSITLPALFVLALLFFWHGLTRPTASRLPITDYLLSGLFLGLTFYTYIPSRALWLVFPLTWGYVWLVERPAANKAWRGLLLLLVLAGLLGLPLFRYLQTNPGAEIRIQELSRPLTAVAQGDFSELGQNISSGLGVITFSGDDFWRYNLPGRPFLQPVMAPLFGLGLLLAGWAVLRPFIKPEKTKTWQSAASFLALVWLAIGLAPVLVTGATLSTTQAIGMQPVVYLLPALALGAGLRLEIGDRRLGGRPWLVALVVLLFVGTAVLTIRDYFMTWAHAPQVRVQYEAAMASAVGYLNEQEAAAAAISTITPDQFHTPALAQMMLTNEAVTLSWFDGRSGLLIPQAEDGLVIVSGFAPLADGLLRYWDIEAVELIDQPASDLDRPLTVYEVNAAEWLAGQQAHFTPLEQVQFGEAAQLLGYDLPETAVSAGESVQLVTLWRLQQPAAGVRLFTHIAGPDGVPLAQADGLAAPGESWQSGDLLLQLHEIPIPAETAVAEYPIIIGLYTCVDPACGQTQRFPVLIDGRPTADHLVLQLLEVEE